MVDTVSTDPFTNLYLDHAAIRRDIAVDTTEVLKEGLKEAYNTRGDVKDARFDIASRIGDHVADAINATERNADRLDKQASDFFIANQNYVASAARDVAALKSATDAGFQKMASDIFTQGALTAAAANLEASKNAAASQLEAAKNAAALQLEMAKNATAVALGQATLSKEIVADGEKTRALINDHKYHDLNRHLIERESALVELASENRHWHHRYDDARWAGNRDQFAAQFAALQSTMQNFNSQLSETRQGMTNFGSMVGVGQSSTANSVR